MTITTRRPCAGARLITSAREFAFRRAEELLEFMRDEAGRHVNATGVLRAETGTEPLARDQQ